MDNLTKLLICIPHLFQDTSVYHMEKAKYFFFMMAKTENKTILIISVFYEPDQVASKHLCLEILHHASVDPLLTV